MRELHQATHPRPFPDHASYPVALVEERVVDRGETGILEEEATLQVLPLQGGVVLPLKGLDGGEHPAALEESGRHLENHLSHREQTPLYLVAPARSGQSTVKVPEEAGSQWVCYTKKNKYERKSSLVAPIER